MDKGGTAGGTAGGAAGGGMPKQQQQRTATGGSGFNRDATSLAGQRGGYKSGKTKGPFSVGTATKVGTARQSSKPITFSSPQSSSSSSSSLKAVVPPVQSPTLYHGKSAAVPGASPSQRYAMSTGPSKVISTSLSAAAAVERVIAKSDKAYQAGTNAPQGKSLWQLKLLASQNKKK